MDIDKEDLLRQTKTLNISQLAKLYHVAYGTMYNLLQTIDYKPKKRGRKPLLTIK